MKTFPKRVRGILVAEFEEEGQGVVFNLKTRLSYTVNSSAAEVLRLCDGKRSREDIAGILAEKYRVSYKRVLSDIPEILDNFIAEGIIAYTSRRADGNCSKVKTSFQSRG